VGGEETRFSPFAFLSMEVVVFENIKICCFFLMDLCIEICDILKKRNVVFLIDDLYDERDSPARFFYSRFFNQMLILILKVHMHEIL
jgi:hypothetical protein